MPSARTLIPRRKLFGNVSFMDGKLSPDGRLLSWIAPVDGVLNIWVAPADQFAVGAPVTRTTGRPIHWHDWSPDGRYILFHNDETGDENMHLFAVDPLTRDLRDLTPLPEVTARLGNSSHVVPGRVALLLNDRDRRWHDIYSLDPVTGLRTLIWENTQNLDHIGLDWQLRPRFASGSAPDGSSPMFRIENGALEPWFTVPFEDNITTSPLGFNRDGTHLHLGSSIGRDQPALLRLDWATGVETIVDRNPCGGFAGAVYNPDTFEIEAAASEAVHRRWTYVAPAVAPDMALIAAELPGFDFHVVSQTLDNRRWVVTAHKPEQPATYFLLDRDRQIFKELFRARPELKLYRLAPMRAVTTKSRDGLDLVSYLTLPADIAGERPPAPLPMVLDVHGGPWARDNFGYNREHQWLADRGYAVLSVNYRGSTGFGKAFVTASEKQHGAKMHDDLIDMVEWAVREGIARRDKVAIFGASYGGYASFLGATFTPEVFCCSVPVVGITNLQTLLESIPPYWEGYKEFIYRSYGDPRTEEGRKLLAERSPIHKVDRIKKPMLIFHGANDVRCKVAESDTIVAAMQKTGIPVTYVVYPDEGHGFAKPANRLSYVAMAEAFFAEHLGGACEPVGTDFEGSSHEVRAGKVAT
jgi:dipeptidyl aminopeptidase/acylaminoacyl peptidase